MKTLIFIRHGKSDWTAGVSDKERQLNHQGLREAPIMAKALKDWHHVPERLYVSSAKRTIQTANILVQELNLSSSSLINSPELYLCDTFTVEEIIRFTPDKFHSIAIVGHNPTLSEVANSYGQQGYVDLPTLGISIHRFDIESWENISAERLIDQSLISPQLYK